MSLCGTTNEQLKIELLSQWKLEAESRNFRRHMKWYSVERRKGKNVTLSRLSEDLHKSIRNQLELDNSKLGSTQQQKICWH